MKIETALGLVEAPLEKNNSQMVSVDRYALKTVLDDRKEQIANLASMTSLASSWEGKATKLEAMNEELMDKIRDLTKADLVTV